MLVKRDIFLTGFIIIFLFLVASSFAHMCHDPFRPKDHLVLVPDKELIKIENKGRFRMYIENTFRSILLEVKLYVESPAFDINIEPPMLERLVPGERTFFVVKLRLRENFEPGDYPLRIKVGAKSAEIKPSGEVVVKVEKLLFWERPYFYIILVIFLFLILLWRKIR